MRLGRAIILDGYVDEPTCLGVPPYLSPYPRYAAGVLEEHGISWDYVTIDLYRSSEDVRNSVESLGRDDLLVVVSGLTVPGHYKGGTPLSLSELTALTSTSRAQVLVGGPIRHGYTLTGGTSALPLADIPGATLVRGDLDAALHDLLSGLHGTQRDAGLAPAWTGPGACSAAAQRGPFARLHSFAEVGKWAKLGARLVPAHPEFPNVVVEIETARGCERDVHCTFCTEGLYPTAEYRNAEDIVEEIRALHGAGARHFRLGKQPNFFAWPGARGAGGAVVPAPDAVRELYREIRRAAPDLRTLHIDNVNPGFLSAFPDECLEIARIIADGNTPGDVAALGIESADPEVALRNNLKASAADAADAVSLLNAAGAHRTGRSLPHLLPGINLLMGLPGESARTYETNLRFLHDLVGAGHLFRRVNVRQVMAFPETPLHRMLSRGPRIDKGRFQRFKRKVQEDIEQPMLRLVAPVGTLLPGVITEFYDGDVTFGRHLASYPLLVGFPMKIPLRTVLTAIVVDHGFRSVTGLPHPIPVNTVPEKALASLPGIGVRRARRLASARPFSNPESVLAALDDPAAISAFLADLTYG